MVENRNYLLKDVRVLHIVGMSFLLAWGALNYDFSLDLNIAALIFLSGLLSQLVLNRGFGLSNRSMLSALITCLGLSLLLRTNSYSVALLVPVIAISSKFFIRIANRHFINPANFGVVVAILFFDDAWVSGGQWGSGFGLMLLVVALGSLLVARARASVMSISFLFCYVLIWFVYRHLYLGYELEILALSLSNGSFLVFTFFMVSDPRTSPDAFFAKLMHSFLLALGAHLVSFYFYFENGPILALFFLSPFIPIYNTILKGRAYSWGGASFFANNSKIQQQLRLPV